MMDDGMETGSLHVGWNYWLNKWFYWLMAAGIIANSTGLLLPVMEPDGCLYAMISKTMVFSGDYINLKAEGKDWLDKPHFPFWIVALSFKLLGIHGFAYKLPAIIFWLIGARYVFALARKMYNLQTAQLSVLIYLAAEHLIISNNDVRAEPYLTGLIIAATYYYYLVYKGGKFVCLIYGSGFLAAAVMTKGIFIAGLVASGFVVEWIIKKKWKEFLNFRWMGAIFLLILFITPELYCLYTQFDLHPDKLVYGRRGVSGIHFFFLDSQFGRFLNNGPIQGEGDLLFYTHTLLWSFLPWSVIVILMLVTGLGKKNKVTKKTADYICSGIFITGFILFSVSKFQLPHYLNILYPFLSVMVARYLIQLQKHTHEKIILHAQNILFAAIFMVCILLSAVGGFGSPLPISITAVIMAIFLYTVFSGNEMHAVIGRSFCAVLVANIFLNGLFYPELFRYQAGMMAADWLDKNNEKAIVYTLRESIPEFAFEFYSKQPVGYLSEPGLDTLKKSTRVFATKNKLDSLRNRGFVVKEVKFFPYFHISQLSENFINQQTRREAVDSTVLADISPALH